MSVNLDIYNAKSADYAESYESVPTDVALPYFVERLARFKKKSAYHLLDLGCGSGRDACYFAKMGFRVTAVDGAAAMIDQARKRNPHTGVDYVHDIGPKFNALAEKRGGPYNIILLSAFIFHFDADERQSLYRFIKQVADKECYIHLTLRHGPAADQRHFHEVPEKELQDFAKENGFIFHRYTSAKDHLKRNAVSWSYTDLIRKG